MIRRQNFIVSLNVRSVHRQLPLYIDRVGRYGVEL